MPDYMRYQASFTAAAQSAGLSVDVLGKVFGHDILFASNGLRDRPGVLVFSGFHGEEPAAPLGLLECLRHPGTAALAARLNLGIVPVVNPEGFQAGTRYNHLGESDNWALRFGPGEHPSLEGQLLLDNMHRLEPYATTCFLDMHEDADVAGFYVYASPQDGGGPTLWHQWLHGIGIRRFGKQPDGKLNRIETPVLNGYILGDKDGSFDEWFWRLGTPYVAVTETPARMALEDRVECNMALLQATLLFMGSTANRVAARFLTGNRRRPSQAP